MSDLREIICNSEKPLILRNFFKEWSFLNWSLNDWEHVIGPDNLQFRKGFTYHTNEPQWENKCEKMEIDFKKFQQIASNIENNQNVDYWLYYDYKYLKNCLDNIPNFSWNNFGFPELTKKDSTIWIGTKYAHTCCHVDTYSVNLIAQIYGKKQWILYEPETDLKPTRVPYEESTIFSELNFFSPDEEFVKYHPVRIVTLNPGEALFLPKHWWHYTECLSTAISINTWIPINNDNVSRLGESVVQYFVKNVFNDAVYDINDIKNVTNSATDDFWSLSTEHCFNQIAQCLNNCSNSREKKKQCEEVTLPSTIQEIEPLRSMDEYRQFLINKIKPINSLIESKAHNKEFSDMRKILNACCNYHVIDKITANLLS